MYQPGRVGPAFRQSRATPPATSTYEVQYGPHLIHAVLHEGAGEGEAARTL